MALDYFFEAKHEGCVVRAKARALKHKAVKAVQQARTVETRRGNKTTIKSLTDQGDAYNLVLNRCVQVSISTLAHKGNQVGTFKKAGKS